MGSETNSLDGLKVDWKASAQRKSARMKWIVIFVILLLVLGAIASKKFRPQRLVVKTMTARQLQTTGTHTVLNASGYVTARRQATVSSKVTGKVVEVLIEEGLTVKEGQVLARLDATNVESNLRYVEAQAVSASASLQETQVRLVEAERELKRVTQLTHNKIATDSDLDRAQAEVDSLKAHLKRLEAEVTVAEAQVKLWKQQLEDTIIRAPFSGVVVTKNAQPGEMISPVSAGGGFTRTGICTIVDMESLEIEVDVNEAYIQRVSANQQVMAILDAYPDWQIPSHVIAIVPTADRQKATVRVRVGFGKLDPRILPDMGVKVAFQGQNTGKDGEAFVAVSKAALQRKDNKDSVWVVKDGKAVRREVTVGSFQGDEVVLQSGLSSGDRVILRAPEQMVDGVMVVEEAL